MKRLNDILQGIQYDALNSIEEDIEIKYITSDSRRAKNGGIFVAIRGYSFDGRDFINSAVKAGVRVIVTDDRDIVQKGVVVIYVNDVREAYGIILANFYDKKQPENIVAVTSTSGKSSIVDYFSQICMLLDKDSATLGTRGLVVKGKVYESEKNLTTPDIAVIRKLLSDIKDEGVDYMALEASSHGLSQSRLKGVCIKVGAFDNISHEHLDYHGNMENYFNDKMKLFKDILKNGKVVLNSCNEYYERALLIAKKEGHEIMTYGWNEEDDIRILDNTLDEKGQKITLEFKGEITDFHVPILGNFQVYNICCAICMVLSLGFNFEKIKTVLPFLKIVSGRMEIVSDGIIVDYAHKPEAMLKVIESAKEHFPSKRIKILFGCGGDRDKEKRPIMGDIASRIGDEIIVTDDNPRSEKPSNIRKEIMMGCKLDNVH